MLQGRDVHADYWNGVPANLLLDNNDHYPARSPRRGNGDRLSRGVQGHDETSGDLRQLTYSRRRESNCQFHAARPGLGTRFPIRARPPAGPNRQG